MDVFHRRDIACCVWHHFAGFLQTPYWTQALYGAKESRSLPAVSVDMDYNAVYILHRSTGHSVMISMVQMDIKMNEYSPVCSLAWLAIYVKNVENSLYSLWGKICNSNLLHPVVLTAKVAMMFYGGDTIRYHPMFRLLFTFHKVLPFCSAQSFCPPVCITLKQTVQIMQEHDWEDREMSLTANHWGRDHDMLGLRAVFVRNFHVVSAS